MPTVKLQPTYLIDTREPLFQAYDFSPYPSERIALVTGDYTIKGFESRVAVERKTPDDFAKSIKEDRFWEEMERARAYQRFALVVECSLADVIAGKYNSRIKPASVVGAAVKIHAAYGVGVVWAGDRQSAAGWVREWIRVCCEGILREEARAVEFPLDGSSISSGVSK